SHLQTDFWAQFLNFQQPAMQSMMAAYMEQSKKMFQQMQDQLQSQTRNMFTGFPLAGMPGMPDKAEK
ncbi:MAG: PHB accumulation regulatory domain-containing protein, partial [Azonexus sp.]